MLGVGRPVRELCLLSLRVGEHLSDLEQGDGPPVRSEEHTSELQSHSDLVCRLLLEKKKTTPLRAGPLLALIRQWPLLFTVFLPYIVLVILFETLGGVPGWQCFSLSILQQRYGPVLA